MDTYKTNCTRDIRGLGAKVWLVEMQTDDEAVARDYSFLLTAFFLSKEKWWGNIA